MTKLFDIVPGWLWAALPPHHVLCVGDHGAAMVWQAGHEWRHLFGGDHRHGGGVHHRKYRAKDIHQAT